MKLKIKLYFRPSYKDESKKEWTLCILTINGQEHATADIRKVYGEPDEIEVCTSLGGLSKHGTLLAPSIYNEWEKPQGFEMREIEADVLEKDWNTFGISHTLLKHKDIAP